MTATPVDTRTLRQKLQEYGLTAGTLGSSSAQTLMVVLLPVLLERYRSGAIWIGIAIGGEGLFAILVPYWIGALSDHLPANLARRFGRRTLFLIVMAPLMAAVLVLVPFLEGYWPLALAAFVFFAALHGYLTPLWALMVDTVPPARHGRVHGVRGALHSAGLGYGLVLGGLLFSLWVPLPFVLAALLLLASTGITYLAAPGMDAGPARSRSGDLFRIWRRLEGRADLGWLLLANALWTGAVDGIRPFIFLFAAAVLGINLAETSLILLLVIAGLGAGAVILGRLGDRFGHAQLLEVGGLITGLGLAAGFFVRDVPGAIALLLVTGVGASTMIALPYPLFASMAGEETVGRDTGLYVLALGVGRIVAPLIVGATIDLSRPLFPELRGYPMMWPVAGLLAIGGVLALRRSLRHAD